MATVAAAVNDIHAAVACLQRLAAAFVRRRQQLARSVRLTEHQWAVLEEISTEHFVPSMFAKSRSSSAAAVSKTLRQLVNKDLVNVSLSSADARQRDYVLTTKGRKIMATLQDERERAITTIWVPLDRREVARFAAFGNVVAARIEDYANHNKEQ